MLTDDHKAMIDLAAGNYKYAGSLEDLVKERFGLTPTRYWQVMNQLLQTSEAAAYRPEAVRRLNARRRPKTRLHSRLLP
ncbi:DUF3263 domain-containing protein [Arthrobacter sp. ISL-85]|uniref:DUF3263 domain-containing protein n=1 Tax=Arthrobacter sp. ISL-85 TaxID=2819115 RepID=UPI00255328B6|nr:DUF3263 domain-containing protein [Arthrobacter sp. ISL-85]